MNDQTSAGTASGQTRTGDKPARRPLSGAGIFFLRQREASILIAGILLVIYFQISSSAFLSGPNLGNLVQYSATTAIIAAGEVFVLVCGELDLSVGMVYALTPFVMFFAVSAGLPVWLAVILGLLAAAVVGLINGAVTTLLKVPSFVTTLGMLFLINGFTLTISGGFPVQPQAGAVFTGIFGANALALMAWAVVIALLFQFVLKKTRWGLHTVATGGNPHGAAEVGIKTKTIKTGNFVLCSVLGGLAGILDAFRIGSIDPLSGGTEIMFAAIASAVIGGTLLAGGVGTILGALLGALVLGILKDGFTLLGVSAYTFDMILGGAILVTMVINVRLTLLKERGGL
ncbi:ABC transporter permease [Pararhizobium mangrovi]|uniref:ABC transporter permease n=1 Tax=Pararhizobium mangrovi TaxID=2590452 RepID=A0A506TXY6_9HYPH|nr:ABC transporter permease [Pararhizobium mangrovi]TPW26176.1 ABC transporter permease [Pararhizobium mangrovi]